MISDPIGALAHLRMGRAYAVAGDKAKAKSAYQNLLSLWKDADPSIPILSRLMLTSTPPGSAATSSIEVILVGHLHGKIGAGQAWGRDQGQEETNSHSREHKLGLILLLCPNMI